jgi:DNA-binding GntR family transcriptional regulator
MTRALKRPATRGGNRKVAPKHATAAGRPRKAATSISATPQSESLRGEFVYAHLRNEIRSGALMPGSRMRETEIAERLQVSRTPVREALKRLQSEGLVTFSQPRGMTVTELSAAQVLELYAMREILEGAAARFASEHASAMEVETLKHLVAQHPSIRTPEEAHLNNRRIDEAIASAAHNIYLLKALNVLQDAVSLLGPTTYHVPGRIKIGLNEIAHVVNAIANRDPDEAENAARSAVRAAGALRLVMRLTA